jgi:hypothetical protein
MSPVKLNFYSFLKLKIYLNNVFYNIKIYKNELIELK